MACGDCDVVTPSPATCGLKSLAASSFITSASRSIRTPTGSSRHMETGSPLAGARTVRLFEVMS